MVIDYLLIKTPTFRLLYDSCRCSLSALLEAFIRVRIGMKGYNDLKTYHKNSQFPAITVVIY